MHAGRERGERADPAEVQLVARPERHQRLRRRRGIVLAALATSRSKGPAAVPDSDSPRPIGTATPITGATAGPSPRWPDSIAAPRKTRSCTDPEDASAGRHRDDRWCRVGFRFPGKLARNVQVDVAQQLHCAHGDHRRIIAARRPGYADQAVQLVAVGQRRDHADGGQPVLAGQRDRRGRSGGVAAHRADAARAGDGAVAQAGGVQLGADAQSRLDQDAVVRRRIDHGHLGHRGNGGRRARLGRRVHQARRRQRRHRATSIAENQPHRFERMRRAAVTVLGSPGLRAPAACTSRSGTV